jgi:hypothetical protein
MTRSKLMKAKAKLNVLRLFGGKPVGAPGNVAEAMSNALQQKLDKSADLYAVDVAKWVQVFWEDPVLERRVHAISEIGWAVYLCGEPLQVRAHCTAEHCLSVAHSCWIRVPLRLHC